MLIFSIVFDNYLDGIGSSEQNCIFSDLEMGERFSPVSDGIIIHDKWSHLTKLYRASGYELS
jgi:hypothetical protein